MNRYDPLSSMKTLSLFLEKTTRAFQNVIMNQETEVLNLCRAFLNLINRLILIVFITGNIEILNCVI